MSLLSLPVADTQSFPERITEGTQVETGKDHSDSKYTDSTAKYVLKEGNKTPKLYPKVCVPTFLILTLLSRSMDISPWRQVHVQMSIEKLLNLRSQSKLSR